MKHILTTDQFLFESENQMYVLYFPSDIDIRGRSYLPSRWDTRWDSPGKMIATYPMIQDAVAHMIEEGLPHLYQVVVNARIITEPELYMKLSEKGFNAEDMVDTLEKEGRLPQSLSKTDLADLQWYWQGFEVGDKVWVADLNQISKSVHAVQPSEIERVRKNIGL
jgi:hypothetical protein